MKKQSNWGMLPLAVGVGSGADMLRPLAIAVIGALCISALLSLVATPVVYCFLRTAKKSTSDQKAMGRIESGENETHHAITDCEIERPMRV